MTTILENPTHGPDRLAEGAPASTPPPLNRRQRLIRGRPEDPTWVRPAFFGLLIATAGLYLWGLSASGWANSFYSAAAQAGSESWKAFFFGSSDAANSITVDKPPAALWFMAISVRIFGLSSFAILLPQALMGVGTVGVLYAAVRRNFSAPAGLLAGAVLALTPVATLMFRFNNPDALLTLVLTGAAYTVIRAIEDGRTRWLLLAGALVGLGFLAKQLQAVLVLPTFAGAYLVAGPKPAVKRILGLVAAFGAMVVAAGWWIVIVELVPAQYRPYIGGSQTNSILELTLGYNGLGRLNGDETGSVGGNANWGATGIGRMFNSELGGQIAWLIPAALMLLVAGLWLTRRAPRTDRTRAAFLLWGGWLLVTGLIFSFMQGIFHAYYTVALAPAIAALIGIGVTTLWRQRDEVAMTVLAAIVAVTALWSYTLLSRADGWHPWIKYLVLVTGVIGALGLALGRRVDRRLLAVIAATAVFSGLAGPTAYSISTAATAHTGSIVTAGPAVAGGSGGRGGGGGARAGQQQQPQQQQPQQQQGQAGPGQGQAGGTAGGFGGRRGGGAGGGLLNSVTPSADLVAALKADSSSYTWVAAAIGSNNASGYQLASELPVMALGGFNGSDPSPTLAQFQAKVAAGQIHYFIAGSGLGGNSDTGGSNAASQISAWVTANYTPITVGTTTMYDLGSTASVSTS